MNEKICSSAVPCGMMDAILQMGSTHNVIAGHDHGNSLSLRYKGVRLSYAMKCGDECTMSADRLNGGSALYIDDEGKADRYEQVFIPPTGIRHTDPETLRDYLADELRERRYRRKEKKEEAQRGDML